MVKGTVIGTAKFRKNKKSGKMTLVSRAPSKPAVTAIVKRVLNSELETKYASTFRNNTTFNSAVSNYNEAYPALALVTNASTPSQTWLRAGDKITCMSARLNIQIGLANIARTSAFRVHLWVLTMKRFKNYADIAGLTTQPINLFNNGAGTIVPYDGIPTTSMHRYNYNDYTVLHHKSFVLLGNVGLPNQDTTSGNAPNVNAGCAVRRFSLDLKAPKTLKYLENSSQGLPLNYAPFFVIGYEKIDGTGPDVTNQSVVASWNSTITFKDA